MIFLNYNNIMGNQPSGPSDTYIIKKTKKKESDKRKETNKKEYDKMNKKDYDKTIKKEYDINNNKGNDNYNNNDYLNKNYTNNFERSYNGNNEQYFRQQPLPPKQQPIYDYYNNVQKTYEKQNDFNKNIDEQILNKLNEKKHSNNALIERNMLSDIYIDKTRNTKNNIINYPSNSNNELSEPKKNFDNIEFTPYNFNDEVTKYKKTIINENEEFEKDEIERRNIFNKKQKEKEEFLNKQIELFEQKYDPWSILGLENGDYNIDHIKKAYKKSALKYHPDRAGDKYKDMFQIITQSYIYLLKKAEEKDSLNQKMKKPVTNMKYEDDINEAVENIYIDKDKFDVNQFNKIFEKYKIPSSFDKGYGDLASENINNKIEDEQIFGRKFNNDIFNAHFNNIKSNKKKSNQLIEYKDPEALESSLVNLNTTFLGGIDEIDDFGSVNASNNLSYTDYKKAHIDETMLIDVNKVKYKTYNSIDHLENERSKLSYDLSPEDKRRNEYLERKRLDDDNYRIQRQNQYDNMVESQYRNINQKLIVHK